MARLENGKIIFDESDYGGAELFGIKFKAPYQNLFKWAYRKHDLQYQLYKPKSLFGKHRGKSKFVVDKEFLDDMVKIAKRKTNKDALAMSYVLYSIVSTAGWIFWLNRKEILDRQKVEDLSIQ